MYGNSPTPLLKKTPSLTTHKVDVLLHELSDDENNDKDPDVGDPSSSQHVLWHSDFHGYLNSRDELGMMSIVEWWGVCTQNKCPTHADMLQSQLNANQYPVWAPLAQDHLPVMALSVSSERAFSSAGIMICKHCSQLKPDIVEALQFMKCLYCQELLFREEPSTAFEGEEELFEVIGDAA